MTNPTSSFKYVEYKGEDASDVLVSLVMNLAYPDMGRSDSEEHDLEGSVQEESDLRTVGFSPNPDDDGGDDE